MQLKYWLILGVIVLVSGTLFMTKSSGSVPPSSNVGENVSVVSGQQIIALAAKGGFSPTMSTAEAGVASILRVSTNGTFDCSSSISIPSLGYRGNLPPSGITDIEIPAQAAGTTLNGTCSMGMYNFAIAFK
jgi:plastocyanin domain-containing protein